MEEGLENRGCLRRYTERLVAERLISGHTRP